MSPTRHISGRCLCACVELKLLIVSHSHHLRTKATIHVQRGVFCETSRLSPLPRYRFEDSQQPPPPRWRRNNRESTHSSDPPPKRDQTQSAENTHTHTHALPPAHVVPGAERCIKAQGGRNMALGRPPHPPPSRRGVAPTSTPVDKAPFSTCSKVQLQFTPQKCMVQSVLCAARNVDL